MKSSKKEKAQMGRPGLSSKNTFYFDMVFKITQNQSNSKISTNSCINFFNIANNMR